MWNFSNRRFETISGELHSEGSRENLISAKRSGHLFLLCFQPSVCVSYEYFLSLGLSFLIPKTVICQWNMLIIPIKNLKITNTKKCLLKKACLKTWTEGWNNMFLREGLFNSLSFRTDSLFSLFTSIFLKKKMTSEYISRISLPGSDFSVILQWEREAWFLFVKSWLTSSQTASPSGA